MLDRFGDLLTNHEVQKSPFKNEKLMFANKMFYRKNALCD